MFAIEEELDKKLWLYAIHIGKDRSEVVNDLLRPVVASMVLYDSRDRRGGQVTLSWPSTGPATSRANCRIRKPPRILGVAASTFPLGIADRPGQRRRRS